MPPALDALRARLAELADLSALARLAGWDQRTMMPPGGAPARAHMFATLERLAHDHATADAIGGWLDRSGRRRRRPIGPRPRPRAARAARLRARPADPRGARGRPRAGRRPRARRRGRPPRAADDFAAFVPALRRNVELARAYAACFDDVEHPYDALLADYDFGLTAARVKRDLRSARDGAVRPRRGGRRAAGRPAPDGPARRPARRGRRGARAARRDRRQLAGRHLAAPVHLVGRGPGHADHDPVRGGREARAGPRRDPRVRPRPVRAPDPGRARRARTSAAARRCPRTSRRASCGRTTSGAIRRSLR